MDDQGIHLGDQVRQSKVNGETRIEGSKRPRFESEARTEGEARGPNRHRKGPGERFGEPLPMIFFEKSNLKLGASLKQIFETNDNMVRDMHVQWPRFMKNRH